LAKKWKNHILKTEHKIVEHHHYKTKGRPKKDQKPDKTDYQIIAKSEQNIEKIESLKKKKGHYIIGGNTDPECLSDEEVVTAYQKQNKVEQGFRFLKDPLFFVSSLFIKTPKRIMALLMVMLLSLLVYGVAERRMRACLENEGKTLPNQLGQSIKTPTLRWVFQLMSGINYLKVFVKGQMQGVINGITALQRKIVSLFGKTVENMYYFSSG
jgi:transposase